MSEAEALAAQLRFQAPACAMLGSPLYADLLERAAADVEAGGPTAAVLRGHAHDSQGSALPLRLLGAVHRMTLSGELPELARLYADPERDADATWEAFAAALAARSGEVRALVERPVQTNEVGRCAALLPGFLAVAAATGLPLRLLELGASAGLNLRWDRYRYEAGDFSWGEPGAPLTLHFELEGRPASAPGLAVAERRGCDRRPLDPTGEEGRLTLLSYLWADQPARAARMRAAIAAAPATPAAVDEASAAEWLAPRLAEPRPGVATVVFHSIVMQYLPDAERVRVAALLAEAGARASTEAPLARLAMESVDELAELRLTLWPGGEERVIGRAGYHGDRVLLA